MRITRPLATAVLAASTVTITATSQRTQDPLTRIREADIKADLFALAGDATRGREGGTLDELSASAWLAERAREAGLQPAGDNGTYFQFFPLDRFRQSASSIVTVGGKPLRMGRDVVTDSVVLADFDAAATTSAETVTKGQALVVTYVPGSSPAAPAAAAGAGGGRAGGAGQAAANAMRTWARSVHRPAIDAGAVAVIVIVPDAAQDQWERVSAPFSRGRYALDPEGTADQLTPTRATPLLYVRESAIGAAGIAANTRVTGAIFTDSFTYPSVNVIARVPGRDPKLRDEHVLFSAHQDHDGERYTVNGDKIWNGADDNATTSVALLAIGRAFAARPGRRSALFIWHGAEERGLMGSRWYVKKPTVPLKSIVTVLNGDMMGRNDPKTAALLGALPPHRNSPELVEMAHSANKAVAQFEIDSSWDDPNHREGWYYRSDHLPYARAGIPALFFSSLLHPDYHTPFDNPDRIDIGKLTRMTRWMYATGRAVAEADKAPAVDPSFKLERCRDFTGNYCG